MNSQLPKSTDAVFQFILDTVDLTDRSQLTENQRLALHAYDALLSKEYITYIYLKAELTQKLGMGRLLLAATPMLQDAMLLLEVSWAYPSRMIDYRQIRMEMSALSTTFPEIIRRPIEYTFIFTERDLVLREEHGLPALAEVRDTSWDTTSWPTELQPLAILPTIMPIIDTLKTPQHYRSLASLMATAEFQRRLRQNEARLAEGGWVVDPVRKKIVRDPNLAETPKPLTKLEELVAQIVNDALRVMIKIVKALRANLG